MAEWHGKTELGHDPLLLGAMDGGEVAVERWAFAECLGGGLRDDLSDRDVVRTLVENFSLHLPRLGGRLLLATSSIDQRYRESVSALRSRQCATILWDTSRWLLTKYGGGVF